MTRLEIAQAYEPIEIDLWGTVFETRDVPRSGVKKTGELQQKLEAIQEAQAKEGEEIPGVGLVPRDPKPDELDQMVGILAEMMDVKLVSTNGGRKKPSTLIKAKWQADDLSLGRLFTFVAEIRAAESGDGDPPT